MGKCHFHRGCCGLYELFGIFELGHTCMYDVIQRNKKRIDQQTPGVP